MKVMVEHGWLYSRTKPGSLKTLYPKKNKSFNTESMDTQGEANHASDHEHEEEEEEEEELIVWPWMAVITNISTGECERHLAEWVAQGYNPVKIHPLGPGCCRYYSILEFEGGLGGLADAYKFEKAFLVHGRGRCDWYSPNSFTGNQVHAWIARKEDYDSNGIIAQHLQNHGKLKTVAQSEEDDKQKLPLKFEKKLESKNHKCREMEENISRVEVSIEDARVENEAMREHLNAVLEMIEEKKKKDVEKAAVEVNQRAIEMEAREKQLKELETLIEKRELINKTMREVVAHHQRIVELEKQLGDTPSLELEQLQEKLRRTKALAKLIKHKSETRDKVARKSMDAIKENLKRKEEELEFLEELNVSLNNKLGEVEDEMLDAREELIGGLEGQSARSNIGVKNMEELERSAFLVAAKRWFPAEIAGEGATKLHSLYDIYLGDPEWYPFKIVPVKEIDDHKLIIDKEDEKLKNLKRERGQEVYIAVITALMARAKYNSGAKSIGMDLWNSKEDRKATLWEGIVHIKTKWKRQRQRKYN